LTLIVGLSAMLFVWLAMLPLLKTLIAHDQRNVVFVLFAFLYTLVCALSNTFILFYSYHAMFQRAEREHQKLRVAQLALSIAVLLPTALALAFVVALAPLLTPPG
jgi:hypothetical protein